MSRTPRPARARTAAIVLVLATLGIATGTSSAAAAVPESGSVLAFGSNFWGQLGNTTNAGTTTPNATPTSLSVPIGAGTIVQVAAGTGHTLLVTSSGQLFALGTNAAGQLGIAPASATAMPVPTPVTLPGAIGSVTQAAAGAGFSLALTSSGQLYAFGSNQYGQLGNSTNNGTTTANPTPTLVTLPGQVGTITQVAAGQAHSFALTSSGQLYAFGYNQYGQLGSTTNNGTTTATPTPTLVALPGQIGAIAQVAAGGYHSLALTASGQVFAFGWNYYGQVGNDTNNGTNTANPTPALVTLPAQAGAATQIAAGAYHSLASTGTGQLYAFGGNQSGQLGNATNNNTGNANPVPAQVTLAGRVGSITQFAGGDDDSLVVTSSGQLFSFGDNNFGQLGRATNSGTMAANPTPTLATLAPATTIDTVAKGPVAFHSLALVSNLAIITDVLAAAQLGTPYRATVQHSGGTNPLNWNAAGLPDGLNIDSTTGVIAGTPSAAGTSSPVVTVTDRYGNTVSREQHLSVAAAPQQATAGAARAPSLSALKQSSRRWIAGTNLARLGRAAATRARKHGLPVGTTFSFRLDQAASVTLTFRHSAQGRRVSGTCVTKTHGNAGRPTCTRVVADGSLRVQANSGANKLRFEGRISPTRRLKAGRYTVLFTATSTAGASSPAQSRSFTIAAP